jgi:hypothetical protein
MRCKHSNHLNKHGNDRETASDDALQLRVCKRIHLVVEGLAGFAFGGTDAPSGPTVGDTEYAKHFQQLFCTIVHKTERTDTCAGMGIRHSS